MLFFLVLFSSSQLLGKISCSNIITEFPCYSCHTGCTSADFCDCSKHINSVEDTKRSLILIEQQQQSVFSSKNLNFCRGKSCFIRFESFPEDGAGFVVKGCSNDEPVINGCRFLFDSSSVECSCSTPLCNNAKFLKRYKPTKPPSKNHTSLTCCRYTPNNDDDAAADDPKNNFYHYWNGAKIILSKNNHDDNFCLKTCSNAQYCYANLASGERGCGYGLMKQLRDVRTLKNNELVENDQWMCTNKKRADNAGAQCACTKDLCNGSYNVSSVLSSTNTNSSIPPPTIRCYNFSFSSTSPWSESGRKVSSDDDHKSEKSIINNCSGFCYLAIVTKLVILEASDYTISENEVSGDDDDNIFYNSDEAEDYYSSGDRDNKTRIKNRSTKPSSRFTPHFQNIVEISSGCIEMNEFALSQSRKGCTIEYLADYEPGDDSSSQPLTRYCLCDEDLCNDEQNYTASWIYNTSLPNCLRLYLLVLCQILIFVSCLH